MNFYLFLFFTHIFANEDDIDINDLQGLLAGDLVYIDCQIDSMCAFMAESWLESEGIVESDTPWLTLEDASCKAQGACYKS
mgnify:CR=1 FL=1